jgi:hypothetical protein
MDLLSGITEILLGRRAGAAADRGIEERARQWEADTMRELSHDQQQAVVGALLLTAHHDGVVTGAELDELGERLGELATAGEDSRRHLASVSPSVRAALANPEATAAFIRQVGDRLGDDAVRDLVFERVATLALRHARDRGRAEALLRQFAAGFRLGERAPRLLRHVASQIA